MGTTRPYKRIGQRMIWVCAHCHPGDSIFDLYPRLRGRVEISHGVCPMHKAEWLAELAELKVTKP